MSDSERYPVCGEGCDGMGGFWCRGKPEPNVEVTMNTNLDQPGPFLTGAMIGWVVIIVGVLTGMVVSGMYLAYRVVFP